MPAACRMLLCVTLALFCAGGCYQQKMADQPRFEPLEASVFFDDGQASRHLVPGTVARGHLDLDEHFTRGKVNGQPVEEFPMPVTRDLLNRGRERMEIFCSPCHDHLGTGEGMVVRRGFPHPPSWHSDHMREMAVGEFFQVITHGFGRMPAYGTRLSPEDRWAIVAYLRALQLSQYAPISELPAEDAAKVQGATE